MTQSHRHPFLLSDKSKWLKRLNDNVTAHSVINLFGLFELKCTILCLFEIMITNVSGAHVIGAKRCNAYESISK